MLVSLPLCRLLVSFAGTKHCCLTAVNRDGALCCPDFPRDRGLKPLAFLPLSRDRPTRYLFSLVMLLLTLTGVVHATSAYCFSILKLASIPFSTYREPYRLEVRGGIAVAPMTLTGVVHATSAYCFSILKLASIPFSTYREPYRLEVRGGIAVAPMTLTGVVHATSAFRRRAAYGNRTRLLGLGSRCTTDVLMPQIS